MGRGGASVRAGAGVDRGRGVESRAGQVESRGRVRAAGPAPIANVKHRMSRRLLLRSPPPTPAAPQSAHHERSRLVSASVLAGDWAAGRSEEGERPGGETGIRQTQTDAAQRHLTAAVLQTHPRTRRAGALPQSPRAPDRGVECADCRRARHHLRRHSRPVPRPDGAVPRRRGRAGDELPLYGCVSLNIALMLSLMSLVVSLMLSRCCP